MFLNLVLRVHHPPGGHQHELVLPCEAEYSSQITDLVIGVVIDPGEHPVLAFENEPAAWHQDPVNLLHGQEVESPQVLDGPDQFSESLLEYGAGACARHEGRIKHHRPKAGGLYGEMLDIGSDHAGLPGSQVEAIFWPGHLFLVKAATPKGHVGLDRPGMQGHDVLQDFVLIKGDGLNDVGHQFHAPTAGLNPDRYIQAASKSKYKSRSGWIGE